MKKTYITPTLSMHEFSTEDGILMTASPDQTTGGFGTNTQSGIKDEFSTNIEFDDLSGTDIVKRNPWDSQW